MSSPIMVDDDTWSWKIEDEDSGLGWMSQKFNSNNVVFYIKKKKDYPDLGILYLCEETKYNSKAYDLYFVLEYKSEKKTLSMKNITGLRSGDFIFYAVADIKISDLLEVKCKFLNMKSLSETPQESKSDYEDKDNDDSDDENTENFHYEPNIYEDEYFEEGNNDEQENISKLVKLKGKSASMDGDKYKSRGEIALLEKLKDAYLNEENSDIILIVRDQKFPAHKVIIEALSPVFQRMLKHDMKEKNRGIVDIPDCDPSIFQEFLHYLYTGKSDNLTNDNAFELYYVSDKYDVKELRMDCVDYILENLTVDTICDAIAVAAKHSEFEMLECATKFFIENAKSIFRTVRWQKFMKEYSTEANELIIKAFENE